MDPGLRSKLDLARTQLDFDDLEDAAVALAGAGAFSRESNPSLAAGFAQLALTYDAQCAAAKQLIVELDVEPDLASAEALLHKKEPPRQAVFVEPPGGHPPAIEAIDDPKLRDGVERLRKPLSRILERERTGEIVASPSSGAEPSWPAGTLLDVYLSTGSKEARQQFLDHPNRAGVVFLGAQLMPSRWTSADERVLELLELVAGEKVVGAEDSSGVFPGSPLARFYALCARWSLGRTNASEMERAYLEVESKHYFLADFDGLLDERLAQDWKQFGAKFRRDLLTRTVVAFEGRTRVAELLGADLLCQMLVDNLEEILKQEKEVFQSEVLAQGLVELDQRSERSLTLLGRGCAKGWSSWLSLAARLQDARFQVYFWEMLDQEELREEALQGLLGLGDRVLGRAAEILQEGSTGQKLLAIKVLFNLVGQGAEDCLNAALEQESDAEVLSALRRRLQDRSDRDWEHEEDFDEELFELLKSDYQGMNANLKLAVRDALERLRRRQPLLGLGFRLTNSARRRRLLEILEEPLSTEDLAEIEELYWGHDTRMIYAIDEFWGGEEDHFELKTLNGIELLKNLKMLSIDYANLKDLTPLANLPELKSLRLSYSLVDELAPERRLAFEEQLRSRNIELEYS